MRAIERLSISSNDITLLESVESLKFHCPKHSTQGLKEKPSLTKRCIRQQQYK